MEYVPDEKTDQETKDNDDDIVPAEPLISLSMHNGDLWCKVGKQACPFQKREGRKGGHAGDNQGTLVRSFGYERLTRMSCTEGKSL